MHIAIIYDLQDAMKKGDSTQVGSGFTESERDAFYEAVDTWVISDNNLRAVLAIFPFIVGCRFFKVFSLQPRLGVVTATLQRSCRDIVHYLVVFASIFLVFVISAMILFGHDLDEFTNFGRAMMSVLLVMIGDYDWTEMIRVGRQQTALWFWSFTWLVNLIMLNMLLAIIMDVYTEVKCSIAPDAETMWSQVAEIVTRYLEIKKGLQIDLQVIYEALEMHMSAEDERLTTDGFRAEEERLTIDGFRALVPEMPERQALRLLAAAYVKESEEDNTGGSMSETAARVQNIFKNTQVLHDAIGDLIHMQETTAEMINANFVEMRYHSHHQGAILRQHAGGGAGGVRRRQEPGWIHPGWTAI